MQNAIKTTMRIMSELLETPEMAKELHLNYTESEVEDVVSAIEALYGLVDKIKTYTKDKENFINKILVQYKDIVELVLELESVENLLSLYNRLAYDIEINGECPSKYNGEAIEIITIEHDNILVYLDSSFKIIDGITIYDDEGEQIGDFSLKNINTDNKDLMEMI